MRVGTSNCEEGSELIRGFYPRRTLRKMAHSFCLRFKKRNNFLKLEGGASANVMVKEQEIRTQHTKIVHKYLKHCPKLVILSPCLCWLTPCPQQKCLFNQDLYKIHMLKLNSTRTVFGDESFKKGS